MIIYHGGTDIINIPKIIISHAGRDFGIGFYTTDIYEQAEKWAKRQARYRKKDDAILNFYAIEDSVLQFLKIKTFDGYTLEWLEFIITCRQNAFYRHEYDLVIGKIANDDVGETIQAVIDGFTPKEFALTRLTFMQANNQICFSNENALSNLKFIKAIKVN